MQAKKDPAIAYILWFFLGWLGIHRLYLKRITSGLIYMVMDIVIFFIVLAEISTRMSRVFQSTRFNDNPELGSFGFSGFLSLCVLIFWITDLFLIKKMVQEENDKVESEQGS